MREVHGKKIPRKPPSKASLLHTQPFRSLRYRQWIKSLPSAVSGQYGCDPCHTGPHGYGQKSSDLMCIPLTRSEHEELACDPKAFQEKYGLDVAELVKRLNRAWFSGMREGA